MGIFYSTGDLDYTFDDQPPAYTVRIRPAKSSNTYICHDGTSVSLKSSSSRSSSETEWTLKHYYNGRKYVKSSLTTGNFYFSSDSSGNVILKQYEDSSSPSYLSFIVLEKGADDVRYKIHLPKNPSDKCTDVTEGNGTSAEQGEEETGLKATLAAGSSKSPGEDWYLTNSKKDVKYEKLNSIDGIVRRGDLFSIFEVRNSAASCKGTGWMKREDNQQKYYLE